MDGVIVPVAVVASRTEAELIVGLLRSHGLSAAVSADDAGGHAAPAGCVPERRTCQVDEFPGTAAGTGVKRVRRRRA